jgi:hypothetical protein
MANEGDGFFGDFLVHTRKSLALPGESGAEEQIT